MELPKDLRWLASDNNKSDTSDSDGQENMYVHMHI